MHLLTQPAPCPVVKITYYLEVISSWCYWAEPAWLELKRRFPGVVEFQWKIALMDETGLPTSREQLEWFYRRSGSITRSPAMLNSGWFEAGSKEYLAPNLVTEAAKQLGVTDDRVRLGLAHAALVEGRKVGRWEESLDVAARAGELDRGLLEKAATSPEILARSRESTREFYSYQVNQRPTFVLESRIGDKVVFSGLAGIAPLAAALESMMADAAGYASYAAHFGAVPPA